MLTIVSHTVLQCLRSLCDTEHYGKKKVSSVYQKLAARILSTDFFPHFRVVLRTLGPAILWELLALIHIVRYACVVVLLNRRNIAAVGSVNKGLCCVGPVHLNYDFAQNAAVCMLFKFDGYNYCT